MPRQLTGFRSSAAIQAGRTLDQKALTEVLAHPAPVTIRVTARVVDLSDNQIAPGLLEPYRQKHTMEIVRAHPGKVLHDPRTGGAHQHHGRHPIGHAHRKTMPPQRSLFDLQYVQPST